MPATSSVFYGCVENHQRPPTFPIPPPPTHLPPAAQLTLVLLWVTGVHFLEAYVLNPAIYAAHLHLHPLLVMTVLVMAEHSLGVWGLILAVPSTVFLLNQCLNPAPLHAVGTTGAGDPAGLGALPDTATTPPDATAQ